MPIPVGQNLLISVDTSPFMEARDDFPLAADSQRSPNASVATSRTHRATEKHHV